MDRMSGNAVDAIHPVVWLSLAVHDSDDHCLVIALSEDHIVRKPTQETSAVRVTNDTPTPWILCDGPNRSFDLEDERSTERGANRGVEGSGFLNLRFG